MAIPIPASVRSYLNEPAVPNPPVRVWRDWALVAAASVGAVLEATLRTDVEWTSLPLGWQIASMAALFAVLPAVMIRRTQPLLAMVWGFTPALAVGLLITLFDGGYSAIGSTAVILVIPYALYRWGSGRDGALGAAMLLVAWLIGNVNDPSVGVSEWIGGFIVLTIPVEVGLIVRYRRAARERAIREVQSLEREEIARELHDTVAHHVSAIAVQAQAGRALAASDPDRALEVLAVIEEAASRTLGEMRTMVGTLRAGGEADLAPQQGVADLRRLATTIPTDLRIDVDVDDDLGQVGPAVDAAIFRIAQESITNAVRHARQATEVRVQIAPAGDLVRLTVTDDGASAGSVSDHGYGLLGMAERAHLLGGRLTAGPSNGRGWRVTAELPRAKVAS